tara:strand:- start:856 stop:1986 length:1131 start_codon:yes stop_codon:yes gene_type:complete
MYVIEFMRIFFTNDYSQVNEHIKNLIFIIVLLLAVIQFSYLFNIDNIEKLYKIFLKPYFMLCLGISIMAVFNLALIKVGLIDISSWSIPSWLSSGMVSRDAVHAHYGGTYKFPLFSTIIYTALSSESLLNYQGIQGIGGQVIGLSFEPHIALAFMAPTFFLTSVFYKHEYRKVVLVNITFFIMTLAAGSATSFIIIPLLLSLFFIKRIINSGLTISKFHLKIFLIAFIILLIGIYVNREVVIYALERFGEVSDKSSSGGKALIRLFWLFSPKSLFGSGMFPSIQGNWWFLNADIGYLPMLAFLMHFSITVYYSLKLFFSKSEYAVFGLSIMYLLFHSLKIYTDLPQNQLYIFILFILCCHLNDNSEKDYKKASTVI